MQVEDSQFEIFFVLIAISVALQGSDFAVECLQLSGADRMFVPVKDEWLPSQPRPVSSATFWIDMTRQRSTTKRSKDRV